MRHVRQLAAVVLLAGFAVVGTPGIAAAASCTPGSGWPSGGGLTYRAYVNCDISVQQITITARLYEKDVVTGAYTQVASSTTNTYGASHGEASASIPCPAVGVYHGDYDVTIVWPNGSTVGGSYAYSVDPPTVCV